MICIVRHGQTDWNVEGRYQGRCDTHLNEVGIMQAREIASKINNKKFDVVFSSPLKRAYETAQILTDQDIIVDDRLMERSNGDFEGKLKTEIEGKIDFNDPSENRIENINDFRNRIEDFFLDITKNYKDKNVLVVTHGGVCIYARCFFEGEPLDGDYSNYKVSNCEYLEYEHKVKSKRKIINV